MRAEENVPVWASLHGGGRVIAGPVLLGRAREKWAAAEVEYANGSVETRWGALRAKNGHPAPYQVKYWQIGNEVDVAAYNQSVRAFAEAMKKADPSIKLFSSFPTKGLLEAAGTAFDYLSPHHYEIDDLAGADRNFKELQDWI